MQEEAYMARMDAVLFDMDGTLFDTEKLHQEGWQFAGVPSELSLTFTGRSPADIGERLEKLGYDPAAVLAKKQSYTKEAFKRELVEKSGAREALEALKAMGLKLAVATSSPVEVADDFLERSGFAPLFDEVVSGHELKRGKPAPDIFLMAAKQVGASPDRCIVVEDAFTGIRAAKEAGMIAVMVPDLVQPDEEIRGLADVVLGTLHELPAYVRGLL